MCILCTKSYNISLTELNCNDCQSIKKIPSILVNLTKINCDNTKIKKIPKELVNLYYIDCRKTKIKEIPKELVNLGRLDCDRTAPPPPFNFIYYIHNVVIQDKSWFKTKYEIKKIIKLQKYIKLYLKLPTLWRIAEYYTKKKYSPENILKYINLE